MTTISDGTLHIYTYKDGVLSRLGHDLRLRCRSFEVSIDGTNVAGRFDVSSIELEGAVRGDALALAEVSDKDRREILETMHSKVLESRRHPEVRFSGEAREAGEQRVSVAGQLELHGRRQPLDVDVERTDGRLRGRVSLRPSRWGIAPFKAFLGALRLQDRVEIAFDLPDAAT